MDDKISLRGRTARRVVQVANHLPFNKNGELRRRISRHEKEWVCPPNLEHRILSMDNFNMELLKKEGECEGIILQLHGGGYYGRLHNGYRDMAVLYHEVSGGYSVLSADYRVAPEDPFPAALDDALCAYRWIIEQGYPPEKIIVAGDSAGGGLALALILHLRDHGQKVPAGVITMSAWTDLTGSGESYTRNFDIDPIFGRSSGEMLHQGGYYQKEDPQNPYISPVFGGFKGFPPMLMQVGEREMLLSDTLTVAQKAKDVDVPVSVHIYKGMFHVFQMGLLLYPESREAWEEVGQFIRSRAV